MGVLGHGPLADPALGQVQGTAIHRPVGHQDDDRELHGQGDGGDDEDQVHPLDVGCAERRHHAGGEEDHQVEADRQGHGPAGARPHLGQGGLLVGLADRRRWRRRVRL
jgi:hypothetical protein